MLSTGFREQPVAVAVVAEWLCVRPGPRRVVVWGGARWRVCDGCGVGKRVEWGGVALVVPGDVGEESAMVVMWGGASGEVAMVVTGLRWWRHQEVAKVMATGMEG